MAASVTRSAPLLAQAAKVHTFNAGEPLYSQNETGDCLHLVVEQPIRLHDHGKRIAFQPLAREDVARARDEREQAAELPPDVVGNFRF